MIPQLAVRCLLPLLLLLLAIAPALPTAATRPTYVVALDYEFRFPIAVGSQAVPYEQTADTGSGIVNFPCNASCPVYYNPPNSTTFVQPTAAACAGFEDGNATCTWSDTYHPSNETISGNIIMDTLSLTSSSPPLTLPGALLGCSLYNSYGATPCSKTRGTAGSFGGMDRGNSSVISQLYAARAVDNTVGFCAPYLPPPNATDPSASTTAVNSTTYLLLGSARPVGLSGVKRTDFLSPAELAAAAAAAGWPAGSAARMALRYVAAITSVSFANQTFHFNSTNGTANMDTGGGAYVAMPPPLVSAYLSAVAAAVAAAAPALNLTFNSTTGCITTLNRTHDRQPATTNYSAIQALFPSITLTFRGRDKARALLPSQALTTQLPSLGARSKTELCSVVSVTPSSIPTAFWPSQPFFRGRYAGFDRRRNALLLSQPFPCVDVTV